MSPDIKQLVITGPAKDQYLGGGITRKRKQRGGYDAPPPAPFSAGANAPSPVASSQVEAPLFQSSTPVSGGPVSDGPASGGTRKKLVLLEKKKKTLLLSQKDPRSKKKYSGQINTTRKVRIRVSNIRTRMTRANKIHAKSKTEPIEQIIEKLVDGKIIKKRDDPPSEEREKLLRGMYRDYLQLRTGSL